MLLLDEPFGALDAKVRKELRRWLRRLHDELHITSVFVTHDQEEALEVADRVVVMNHGRIEQIGTPRRGLRAPGHAVRLSASSATSTASRAAPTAPCCASAAHTLAHDVQGLAAGAPVLGFARPHELDIVTRCGRAKSSRTASRPTSRVCSASARAAGSS